MSDDVSMDDHVIVEGTLDVSSAVTLHSTLFDELYSQNTIPELNPTRMFRNSVCKDLYDAADKFAVPLKFGTGNVNDLNPNGIKDLSLLALLTPLVT